MTDLPSCDFTTGAVRHRLQFGGGRGQDLPKAVGMKNGLCPTIIDATAGQGKDAFLLASLGSHVTMIERSDKMHQMLADALIKAQNTGGIYAEITSRMRLLHGNSIDLLPTLSADVIVVDPMHPARKKSALVNGDMQKIQALVGTDPDQRDLIETALKTALETAAKRVVVKWPTKAERLDGLPAPSHQIIGKAISFDVFMVGL